LRDRQKPVGTGGGDGGGNVAGGGDGGEDVTGGGDDDGGRGGVSSGISTSSVVGIKRRRSFELGNRPIR